MVLLSTIRRNIWTVDMPPKPSPRLFSTPPRFLCPSIPRRIVRSFRTFAPISPQKPTRFDHGPNVPLLAASQKAAFLRKEPMLPQRTGALAIKYGMTGMYDAETAKRIPCTVLQLDRCQVTGHKRRDKHGYWAVQVGSGTKEARKKKTC